MGFSQLQKAVTTGDIEFVRSFFSKRILPLWFYRFRLNRRHGFLGDTLLHISVREDHEAIVQLLVEHHLKLNRINRFKETALVLAIKHQKIAIATYLIKAGANLEIADDKGNTPLTLAATLGLHELVCLLFEHGAKLQSKGAQCQKIYDAQCTAASEGYTDILRLMLENGAPIEGHIQNKRRDDILTPLETAYHCDQKETAFFLMKAGADCFYRAERSSLRVHPFLHCEDPLEKSLLKEIKKHHEQKSAWIKAHAFDLLENILPFYPNPLPPQDRVSCLKRAWGKHMIYYMEHFAKHTFQSKQEFLRFIEEKDKSHYCSLLARSCQNDNIDFLILLLKLGFDPNQSTNDAHLSLFIAISKRSPELVRLLLEAGANTNVCNYRGMTPLEHLLCGEEFRQFDFSNSGNTEILKLLILFGNDSPSYLLNTGEDNYHTMSTSLASRTIAQFILESEDRSWQLALFNRRSDLQSYLLGITRQRNDPEFKEESTTLYRAEDIPFSMV